MKNLVAFILCTLSFLCYSSEGVDLVRVDKSERKMHLIKNNITVKTYEILIGENPIGAKEKLGDKKTPEGVYLLDYKNDRSTYYKSIHISYPNEEDRKKADQMGWNPGGGITIHGEDPQGVKWTRGCIAVSNEDMDDIWKLVDIPTPIIIRP